MISYITMLLALGTGVGTFLVSPSWILLVLPLVSVFLLRYFQRELGDTERRSPVVETPNPTPVFKGQTAGETENVEKEMADTEIYQINTIEIPELRRLLPYQSWFQNAFMAEGIQWRFVFDCRSFGGRFYASALGQTPREAFIITKQKLLAQIREWHSQRFEPIVAQVVAAASPHEEGKMPHVLIVDDDIDLALSLQTALDQLGCKTSVATHHEDLHRTIADEDLDYIFKDWRLNNEVTANRVVSKTVRLIDTFSDLREKFSQHRPRIVTHSVVGRSEIDLPTSSADYFEYLDHWQKPMAFSEVVRRASDLLATK